MLVEFNTLENENPRGFQRVTQLIGHLMRHQFIHAEDRGAATLLETLHRRDLARLVEAYFDVVGYRLVHRQTEGWAGLIPDPERLSLPKLKVEDTIVLLVMRRLWEEALQLGEINENGTVRTTHNEAYAAYQSIVAGTRRAAIAPSDFRARLQMLEKRSIVRLGEMDADSQDMELDIRALVTSVAGDDFVGALEQIVSRPVASLVDQPDIMAAESEA